MTARERRMIERLAKKAGWNQKQYVHSCANRKHGILCFQSWLEPECGMIQLEVSAHYKYCKRLRDALYAAAKVLLRRKP